MPTPLTPIHKRYYQPGALAAALKKKFRRPEDALVALGLDPGLIKLGFDAQPEELKRQLVSRDQVPFAECRGGLRDTFDAQIGALAP